jgi:hypothetical protein
MPDPSDFLPFLIQYGNIAHEHLLKHLTNEQISDYLDYLHKPATTHGEAFRRITVEDGHPTTIFYALESLGRINALCNAAECPSEESITPESAFQAAFAALQAGMMIGAIADDKGKEAIIALAQHGRKFAANVGGHDDDLTKYLLELFQDFQKKHVRYPRNKEVLNLLESKVGQGFIYSVDDEEIEWGKSARTKISTMGNRFTAIRKKLGIKKSR